MGLIYATVYSTTLYTRHCAQNISTCELYHGFNSIQDGPMKQQTILCMFIAKRLHYVNPSLKEQHAGYAVIVHVLWTDAISQ